jgi:hypothetical protein
MKENGQDDARGAFESRSRLLFDDSVAGLDMRLRSRLTQARHAALEAASRRRPWFFRPPLWAPAAGVSAAALLGVALWLGISGPQNGRAVVAENPASLEDLDIVASGDGSGDAMEMLQDDLDFYDFADKAANPGPAA